MERFFITYLVDGVEHVNAYAPDNKEEALKVGHELVRDGVADFFRIDRVSRRSSGPASE